MNRLEGRFAALQILGGRDCQEDDYGLVARDGPGTEGTEMLVLADGMGGHVSGDTASGKVVKAFTEHFHHMNGPISDRLLACLQAANKALATTIEANHDFEGMGSTVVAAVITRCGIEWISVGDSLLWLFRDGALLRLNADHSMAPVMAEMVATGRMTEKEAETDPNRNALRSAVMGKEIRLVDVSAQPVSLRERDRVLMSSDGLLTLREDEIACIMNAMSDAPLEDVAGTLIAALEKASRPGQDNTTVLLYTPFSIHRAKSRTNDAVLLNESNHRWVANRGLIWPLLCGAAITLMFILYWLGR